VFRRVVGAPPRRAFTLLELLLVLGMLVVLSGMAWPVLDRLLTSERLAKSADRMRAVWTTARGGAIESGRILAFRYEPDGARYRLELKDETDESERAEEGLPSSVAKLPLEQTLPSGVRFVAQEDDEAKTEEPVEPAASDSPDQTDASLSEPILFFPDGTCSTARLTLRNDSGWRVEVQLRGLTGVVTSGRPQRSEEDLP
jgi:hypothetical protein